MKKAIICGTKEDSIGRLIAEHLAGAGWDVWLYSRSAVHRTTGNIHERRVDIMCKKDIDVLLTECNEQDLVVMSADTGGGFGHLRDIEADEMRAFLDSKVLGSILFVRALLRRNACTKIVFLTGKIGQKSEDLLLYGVANNALMALVQEINGHFRPQLEAYYLETPVIWPSPVARKYVDAMGKEVDGHNPSVVMRSLQEILRGKYAPGFVPFLEGKVL